MPGPFKFLSRSEENKALKELDQLIRKSAVLNRSENKKQLKAAIARAGINKLAIIKGLINLLKHDHYSASQSYKKYIDDYMLHQNPRLAVLANLIAAGPRAGELGQAISITIGCFFRIDDKSVIDETRTEQILALLRTKLQTTSGDLYICAAVKNAYSAFFDQSKTTHVDNRPRTTRILTILAQSSSPYKTQQISLAIQHLHQNGGIQNFPENHLERMAHAAQPLELAHAITILKHYNLDAEANINAAQRVINTPMIVFQTGHASTYRPSHHDIYGIGSAVEPEKDISFLDVIRSFAQPSTRMLPAHTSRAYPYTASYPASYFLPIATAQLSHKPIRVSAKNILTQAHLNMFIALFDEKSQALETNNLAQIQSVYKKIKFVMKYITFSQPFTDLLDLNNFIALLNEHNIMTEQAQGAYAIYLGLSEEVKPLVFDALQALFAVSMTKTHPIYNFSTFIAVMHLAKNPEYLKLLTSAGPKSSIEELLSKTHLAIYSILPYPRPITSVDFLQAIDFGLLTAEGVPIIAIALNTIMCTDYGDRDATALATELLKTQSHYTPEQISKVLFVIQNHVRCKLGAESVQAVLQDPQHQIALTALANPYAALDNPKNTSATNPPAIAALFRQFADERDADTESILKQLVQHRLILTEQTAKLRVIIRKIFVVSLWDLHRASRIAGPFGNDSIDACISSRAAPTCFAYSAIQTGQPAQVNPPYTSSPVGPDYY